MSVKQDEQCEWCEKQEKLLIKWAEKAAGYRWLHNHARLFYKKQNDWLAYPSIVIASITGVGGFAVLNPSGNDGVSDDTKNKIMIIQMELSLDVKHRDNVVEFIMKCREDYDKLLDDSPDIPAITIQAFLVQFPDKENKPDVCNGLSIIVNDDAVSLTGSRRTVSRWLGAFSNVNSNRRRSNDIERMDSIEKISV